MEAYVRVGFIVATSCKELNLTARMCEHLLACSDVFITELCLSRREEIATEIKAAILQVYGINVTISVAAPSVAAQVSALTETHEVALSYKKPNSPI